MVRYRIEVGREHGVQPKHIVGAIANELDMDSQNIQNLDIRNTFSLVDLPQGLSKDAFMHLKKYVFAGVSWRLLLMREHQLVVVLLAQVGVLKSAVIVLSVNAAVLKVVNVAVIARNASVAALKVVSALNVTAAVNALSVVIVLSVEALKGANVVAVLKSAQVSVV